MDVSHLPYFIGPCSTNVLYDIAFKIVDVFDDVLLGTADAADGEEEIGDTTGDAVTAVIGTDGKNRGALQNVKSGYPMQIIAMDIMGPFPKSRNGNKYILVVSDYFTRWVEAYAIPNQEATTVAVKLIDSMFCRYSIPEQLHSDMGAQFESKIIQAISKLLGVNKTHTTPYHPQSDGLVERLN